MMREPRIALLPAAQWPADALEHAQRDGLLRTDGEPIHAVALTMRHPQLAQAWRPVGVYMMAQSTVPARDRELAVLRTAWRCRARYEWAQHVERAGAAGLSDVEITRVTRGADDPDWSAHEAAIIRAVDELHDDADITDTTWAQLRTTFDEPTMLDLVYTIGVYHAVAYAQNACGLPLEPGQAEMPEVAPR